MKRCVHRETGQGYAAKIINTKRLTAKGELGRKEGWWGGGGGLIFPIKEIPIKDGSLGFKCGCT